LIAEHDEQQLSPEDMIEAGYNNVRVFYMRLIVFEVIIQSPQVADILGEE
jgi:hypothetical protein